MFAGAGPPGEGREGWGRGLTIARPTMAAPDAAAIRGPDLDNGRARVGLPVGPGRDRVLDGAAFAWVLYRDEEVAIVPGELEARTLGAGHDAEELLQEAPLWAFGR